MMMVLSSKALSFFLVVDDVKCKFRTECDLTEMAFLIRHKCAVIKNKNYNIVLACL